MDFGLQVVVSTIIVLLGMMAVVLLGFEIADVIKNRIQERRNRHERSK